ncbi:MAG: UDP-N-acetylmuramoyl-tripeptide--D-alanyl-D-alanine ligase [Candidatus Omnitrophica bacterium]|nr:UDP-N-acetylmuramoyl-tripeptide--D-alanyl-D-alanine ligase [Candidatus Omnitrophota bacterium]
MFKIPELLEATGGKLISGNADIGVKSFSIDSRSLKRGEAFIAIKGEKFDGHDFIAEVIQKGASCIISQRGEKKSQAVFIKVKDTTKALGDIARFNRNRFGHIPVIAVSGSNGKTTAKEMIACVLSSKFKVLKNEGTKNNHIGLPWTLLKLDSSVEAVVLEIGTNHFGEVEYLSGIAQANIGVITNIGASHLEYFKDLNGVFKEKATLINKLSHPAIAILNADDKFLRKEALKLRNKPFVIGVGLKKKSDFFASDIKYISAKPGFAVNKRFRFALNTLGYYNIYNSLLAIAVGRIFGLGYSEISANLAKFSLPKGRLNLIKIKGIRFIDDTYNSNPLSMRQALGVLENISVKGKKILVMGDMLELGGLSRQLHRQALKEALKHADTLITVGAETKGCLGKNFKLKNNIFTCATSSEARDLLLRKVGVDPDDIVLVKGSRGMKMEEVFKI